MNMFNILSKLSALESGDKSATSILNVDHMMTPVTENQMPREIAQLPELKDMSTLRALSGLKPVNECGMMGEMMPPATPSHPASFSINASAGSGDEVASMLSQIMNLAGVKPVGDHDMPGTDAGAVMTSAPAMQHGGSDETEIMRGMMDTLNGGDATGDEHGAMDDDMSVLGHGSPHATMATAGPAGLMGHIEDEGFGGEEMGGASPVGDMADEVRDMADTLAQTDPADIGLDGEGEEERDDEAWDNTPNKATDVGPSDTNAHAYQPNSGSGEDRGMKNNPRGNTEKDIEESLRAEYARFVTESSQKKSKLAEGFYYEELAAELYQDNPELDTTGRAEDLLNAAFPRMVKDLGSRKRASHLINYDEDFASDLVSAYAHLQHAKGKEFYEGSHFGNEKLAKSKEGRGGERTVIDQDGKGGTKTTTTKLPVKKKVGEATKEKEPEGLYSKKRFETDSQRIARLAKEKRQAEKKKTAEGFGDTVKKVGGAVKSAAKKGLEKLGHGSDDDMIKDLQRKAGVPQTGKKPA